VLRTVANEFGTTAVTERERCRFGVIFRRAVPMRYNDKVESELLWNVSEARWADSVGTSGEHSVNVAEPRSKPSDGVYGAEPRLPSFTRPLNHQSRDRRIRARPVT